MNIPIALSLLIAGLVLLLFGLDSYNSIQEAFSRLFSGHLSDRTMWLIVAGSVCFIVGLYGCYRSGRRV
jgi:hypothetical protein